MGLSVKFSFPCPFLPESLAEEGLSRSSSCFLHKAPDVPAAMARELLAEVREDIGRLGSAFREVYPDTDSQKELLEKFTDCV